MVKSNSNLHITNFSIDPTSQEITSLEVNGSTISTSADLDDNKTATIDVSTYTEPVEVTPTSGKDGMKKATITLSNIPVPGGVSKLYAWTYSNGEHVNKSIYTITATPGSDDKALNITAQRDVSLGFDITYLTFTDSISSVDTDSITVGNTVFERNSEKDITLVS